MAAAISTSITWPAFVTAHNPLELQLIRMQPCWAYCVIINALCWREVAQPTNRQKAKLEQLERARARRRTARHLDRQPGVRTGQRKHPPCNAPDPAAERRRFRPQQPSTTRLVRTSASEEPVNAGKGRRVYLRKEARSHLHVANVGSVASQQRAVAVIKVDYAYQAASQSICQRQITGGNLQQQAGSARNTTPKQKVLETACLPSSHAASTRCKLSALSPVAPALNTQSLA